MGVMLRAAARRTDSDSVTDPVTGTVTDRSADEALCTQPQATMHARSSPSKLPTGHPGLDVDCADRLEALRALAQGRAREAPDRTVHETADDAEHRRQAVGQEERPRERAQAGPPTPDPTCIDTMLVHRRQVRPIAYNLM